MPGDMSNKMLNPDDENLNAISHRTAIELIQKALDAGLNVTHVYLDTVGPEKKYQEKLEAIYPNLNFTVASKADDKFLVVSAASVVAKVNRDRILKHWEFEEKNLTPTTEFGCGYPGDKITKKWLADNYDPVFGFPSLVRFSWKTVPTFLTEKGLQYEYESDKVMKKRKLNSELANA